MASQEDNAVLQIDRELVAIAISASDQICSLVNMLKRESLHENNGGDFGDVVICATQRLHDLNNLVMSVLNRDEGLSADSLSRVIKGYGR